LPPRSPKAIDVPNTENALQPGVYCNVELKIPRKTPSLIVPSEAIVFNRDGLNVVVVDDGVAHIRQVNVARDFGTSVEVNAGVKTAIRSSSIRRSI
jgi:multidrug efflux pump subunit AcrA (membrane-fusion protein)